MQCGNTLSSIAYNWGTSWQELARQNALSNPNIIFMQVKQSATQVAQMRQQAELILYDTEVISQLLHNV